MAASTPNRSISSSRHADFTRPQEPNSPTNLNRTSKRQQRSLNVTAPPRLELGGSANATNAASKAIGGQLDALDREAKLQRTIMSAFASTVDQFVAQWKLPDERKLALDISSRVVKFLSTSLAADSSSYIPIRAQSEHSAAPTASGPRTVSFADMAKTLKNSGADFRSAKMPSLSSLGRASTPISGGPSVAPTRTGGPTKKREDRRLLVAVERSALLNRPEPFALRQELCAKITGITLASIPLITPTRTGWAITPSDLKTRDLLTTEENSRILLRILSGTAVRQPETWYNYAVPGVPFTMRQLSGNIVTNSAELVTEEVVAQTQETPISCRPSRHGPNPESNRITWIVSFLAPVRPFRLFNSSELSKPIDKKPAIGRHDPGCQGFCNPAKCTRYQRCNNCSTRIDMHDGPAGANCTHDARCANCHGPFPAGHDHCPAAPRRKNGKTIKPTKKELDIIRRHGDRIFRDTHVITVEPQESQPQPQVRNPEAQATSGQAMNKRRRGSVISAYESAGTQETASSSQSSQPSLPPASQPTSSGRPRRSTASGRNLNLANLSAKSLEASAEDVEMDESDTTC
jgi:hypothetical protein